jgi:hypothetical protein
MKLCAAKRHREVVAGAAALADTDPTDATQALFAAQFTAYAIGYLSADGSLTAAGLGELQTRYADGVVAHMQAAVARGCRTPEKFETSHFAPVREHPGYQKLLEELRREAPPK